MTLRRTVVIATTALMAAIAALAAATPAAAVVEGDCEVTVAQRTLTGRSATDKADAIRVDFRDEVVVEGRTAVVGGPHRVWGEVAGFAVTLAEGESDNRSWSRVIDVDEYANHSLGLHRVEIEAPGCRASALVRVGGRPPLFSTAGAVAGPLAGIGMLALFAAWIRGRRLGRLRHKAFDVFAPFDELDDLRSAAEYVGWSEVLGDRLGRALADDAHSNAEILDRLRSPAVQQRLEELRGAGVRTFPLLSVTDPIGAAVALLPRIPWRPRLPVIGTLLAGLGGGASIVVLQQLALHYPSEGEIAGAGLGAALLTLLLAALARTLAVRRANRSLARAEDALLGEDAEPLYPPFEQGGTGWHPTHLVPPSGMAAWSTPDPASSPVAQLDARLPVEVVQRAGEWAWVVCSNGWTGWVDGRLLQPIGDGERPT